MKTLSKNNELHETLKTLNYLAGVSKLKHINKQIDDAGQIITYEDNYHNLTRMIPGKDPTYTIAITAHHDVVHLGRDNCLDNTASCINLIRLCNELTLAGPKYNILCAWTDAEELCQPQLNGVTRLPTPVDYIIDLELTASGSIWTICNYGTQGIKDPDIFRDTITVPMPYNNAYVGERLDIVKGSTCITLISESDLDELNHTGYCKRWRQCHSATDTYNNWFSIMETTAFLDGLISRLT